MRENILDIVLFLVGVGDLVFVIMCNRDLRQSTSGLTKAQLPDFRGYDQAVLVVVLIGLACIFASAGSFFTRFWGH